MSKPPAAPPGTSHSVETRHVSRFRVRLGAEVRHGGRTFTARTRDLSVAGVAIDSDHHLPEGSALQIGLFIVVDEVEDSSYTPLEVRGKVAWAAPSEGLGPGAMGIRFDALSPGQVAGVNRYLRMASRK